MRVGNALAEKGDATYIVRRRAMMVSVLLPAALEERLIELARSRGVSEGELARELIEASIDDLDDVEMAAARLEQRQVALTAEQARKALGLAD
jgi:predicted DNA-binding protein